MAIVSNPSFGMVTTTFLLSKHSANLKLVSTGTSSSFMEWISRTGQRMGKLRGPARKTRLDLPSSIKVLVTGYVAFLTPHWISL
jgi:hypothetical protein